MIATEKAAGTSQAAVTYLASTLGLAICAMLLVALDHQVVAVLGQPSGSGSAGTKPATVP